MGSPGMFPQNCIHAVLIHIYILQSIAPYLNPVMRHALASFLLSKRMKGKYHSGSHIYREEGLIGIRIRYRYSKPPFLPSIHSHTRIRTDLSSVDF